MSMNTANPLAGWNLVKEHFSRSERWNDTQVKVFDTLYNLNIPFVGNPWKAAADTYYGSRKAQEYRDRYGIEGGGHDPRILASMSSSGAAFSGVVNFVSKNLERLYG